MHSHNVSSADRKFVGHPYGDGGTHVRTTAEVGRIRVTKTESKGKGNKRIRLEILDA